MFDITYSLPLHLGENGYFFGKCKIFGDATTRKSLIFGINFLCRQRDFWMLHESQIFAVILHFHF